MPVPTFYFRFQGIADMAGPAAGRIPVENDPDVWSGRALQSVRRDSGERSCINVSGLYWSVIASVAAES